MGNFTSNSAAAGNSELSDGGDSLGGAVYIFRSASRACPARVCGGRVRREGGPSVCGGGEDRMCACVVWCQRACSRLCACVSPSA